MTFDDDMITINSDDSEELDRLLTDLDYHVNCAPDLNLQRDTLNSTIDSIRRRLELMEVLDRELLQLDLYAIRRSIEELGVF